MKICFLSKDYSYNGGGERMLSNLANELCRRGHEISVASFDTPMGKPLYPLDDSVEFECAEIKKRKPNILTKVDYVRYVLKNKSCFDNFDAIIGVGIICNLVLAFCSPKLCTKTIAWEHFCHKGTPFYQKILRAILFNRLDTVVILTERDIKKYKRHNKNTFVIKNFSQMCFRRNPNLEEKKFIFVGRLSKRQKGFLDFLDIIKAFCKKNSEWRFEIIGSGECEKALEKLMAQKEFDARITRKKYCADIQTEMENSSCILMTSRLEGLPMALIEACVCGLPAISYDTQTGPAEIIADGKSGFIVNGKKAFVKKMLEFASDENLQKQLSGGALEESRKFSPEKILLQWEDALK